MAEQLAAPRPVPRLLPAILCRLRGICDGRRSPVPAAGEAELENAGSAPLIIDGLDSPWEYITLVVTDEHGRVVSEGHYGDFHVCPTGERSAWRLAPGEKWVHGVSLLATVPADRRLPGRYAVQAVFEYEGIRASSEILTIQIL